MIKGLKCKLIKLSNELCVNINVQKYSDVNITELNAI